MPPLLIVYGTTDGHTANVAQFLAGELRALGASVDVFQANKADPDPQDYAGVIVAASIHAGGYQQGVVSWARTHANALRRTPAAFLSVCLAVLQKDPKAEQELVAIKNRFVAKTGWEPVRVKQVAGALLYTRYGWIKRLVMRHIVKKAGGATDVSRDYEYTDWAELRAFARTFYAWCGHQPAESIKEAVRQNRPAATTNPA